MKFIEKQQEPLAFVEWKALENSDWQPVYADLSGDVKKSVTEALMNEQGHLCCYCEQRLVEDDCHIEHFKPQSDPACDALDYGNMLCSCQNQLKKGEPRHCGNIKDSWFDESLLVSPLEATCESRFLYTGDGKIAEKVAKDDAATETIKRLALDIPKLNALRASAIEPFLDDALSEDDMQRFVSGYLKKSDNGFYGEFFTTIRYLFTRHATA